MVKERYKLELLADLFNLANKPNVTGVNTLGYSIATTNQNTSGGLATCSTAAPCLNFNVDKNFNPIFGSTTNANSNFIYSPRQIQMGVRFKFYRCSNSLRGSFGCRVFYIRCMLASRTTF